MQRGRAAFRISERVVDALRGDRVAVVPGVADQRPARPVRLAKKIRDGGARKWGFTPGAPQTICEFRGEIEQLQEVPLHIPLVRFELRVRPPSNGHRQAVVGRGGGEPAMRADIGFESIVDGKIAPIGVVGGKQRRLFVRGRTEVAVLWRIEKTVRG
jgi:hypothetical protein